MLIPLEDLIDQYAPNLKKVMEKYPNIKSSITAPDGHIYALPGIDTSTTSQTPTHVDEWILVKELRSRKTKFYRRVV